MSNEHEKARVASEQLIEQLAQLDAPLDTNQPADETIQILKLELDTLAVQARRQASVVPFENEPALHTAVQKLTSIPRRELQTIASSIDHTESLGKIGQYQLISKLGAGGMGQVFQALHPRLEKMVALKVLDGAKFKDSKAIQRFEREMKVIGQLRHPNIVGATDAGESDGKHYLVMELVDGFDLSHLPTTAPVPVAEACALIQQTAMGLAEAHRLGIVHRDIKPSNIMLAKGIPAPTVKILDLGLAVLEQDRETQEEELTSDGQILGTLSYMAPEQLADSREADRRADIYSLGATLFRLLAGEAPFAGEANGNRVNLIAAIVTKEAPSIGTKRHGLPPALVEIVDKMLFRNPNERFATAEQVVDALAPFAKNADLESLFDKRVSDSSHQEPAATIAPTISIKGAVVSTENTPTRKRQPAVAGSGNWKRRAAIAAALGGILLFLGVIVYRVQTANGTFVIEIDEEAAEAIQTKLKPGGIEIHDKQKNATWFLAIGETKRVDAGNYQVKPVPGLTLNVTNGDVEVATREFKLKRNDKILIRVSLADAKTATADAANPAKTDPDLAKPSTAEVFGRVFNSVAKEVVGADSSGGRTDDVALGDIDGDGDLDAVVANGRIDPDGVSQIYLNDGKGNFSTGQVLPTTDGGLNEHVQIADIDGDKDLDILFGGFRSKAMLWINEAGKFDRSSQDFGEARCLCAGDIDGDGDLDVVTTPGRQIFINKGKGEFEQQGRFPDVEDSKDGRNVQLADLNGDGAADAIFGNSNCKVVICLNNGKGKFTANKTLDFVGDFEPAILDVDRDGDLDIVSQDSSELERVFLNLGDATFRPGFQFDAQAPYRLLSGDLDGDGDLDLVAPGSESAIWMNEGNGEFVGFRDKQLFIDGLSGALGDLDGDGDLDLFQGRGGLNSGFGHPDRVWLNELTGGSLSDLSSRAAAEILLNAGQKILVQTDSAMLPCARPGDLPSEPFVVAGIETGPPMSEAVIDQLAEILRSVGSFRLSAAVQDKSAKLRMLSKAESLTALTVHGDQLTSEGLACLPAPGYLTTLAVGANHLVDADLHAFTGLQDLNLTDGHNINGSCLERMPNLKVFHLNKSEVSAFNIAGLKNAQTIRSIQLNMCTNIRDADLACVSELEYLQTLNVSYSSVGDAGLKHLANLKKLIYLELIGTKVTDAGLTHLVGLEKLKTIDLRKTNVTNTGIDKLKEALPDCEILHDGN